MEKEIASQSLSMTVSRWQSQVWLETESHSRILGVQNLNFSFWGPVCHTCIKFQLNNYELSTETDNTLLVLWHLLFPHRALSLLHLGLTQFWEPEERGGASAAGPALPGGSNCSSCSSCHVTWWSHLAFFWAFVSTDVTQRCAVAQTPSWNAPSGDSWMGFANHHSALILASCYHWGKSCSDGISMGPKLTQLTVARLGPTSWALIEFSFC